MGIITSPDFGFGSNVVLLESIELLRCLPPGCVDFCYIDPPFNTKARRVGPEGSYADRWSETAEYVAFLEERLRELHLVLGPEGSVMVHVDPRTSHYVKVMMDGVFGESNFINEIIWSYNSGGAGKRTLAKKHDSILFYGKYKDYTFNVKREPYPRYYGDRAGFHPDGRMLTDVWQIPIMSTTSKERCGYPTQKPVALLERILGVATNPGDLVLDFFCGSGTTGIAAQNLGRRFLLGDNNPEAVQHATERLVVASETVTEPQ